MKTIVNLITLSLVLMLWSFEDKKKAANDDVAEFLTEMADARMMDTAEGKVAMDRGTTQAVIDYGQLMVKDQQQLLQALEALAARKNIDLPKSISDKKAKALRKLQQKSGRDFDKKFLNMICIDHKRDVEEFKDAMQFKDAEVAEFARKNLPMIQRHLAQVEKIKKNY